VGKVRGHIPMRTCIVCGARRSKKELIRLAVDEEGQLLRDEFGKRQGRGAYICERKSCQEGLSKNKRVEKAFKSGKTVQIRS
jgi:predicted RNA-binding protein YlxR (DUF448 family)